MVIPLVGYLITALFYILPRFDIYFNFPIHLSVKKGVRARPDCRF